MTLLKSFLRSRVAVAWALVDLPVPSTAFKVEACSKAESGLTKQQRDGHINTQSHTIQYFRSFLLSIISLVLNQIYTMESLVL